MEEYYLILLFQICMIDFICQFISIRLLVQVKRPEHPPLPLNVPVSELVTTRSALYCGGGVWITLSLKQASFKHKINKQTTQVELNGELERDRQREWNRICCITVIMCYLIGPFKSGIKKKFPWGQEMKILGKYPTN